MSLNTLLFHSPTDPDHQRVDRLINAAAKRFPWIRILATVIVVAVVSGCGDSKPEPSPKSHPVTKSRSSEATKRQSDRESIPNEVSRPEQPISTPADAASDQPAEPLPIYRPADERRPHDDQKLAELGIHRFDSQRLILYTDIEPQVARTLPPLVNQAYDALVEYFGPLPPDRARSEFQMTGYLIKSEALFREAGLIPEDLPTFAHGRHRRNEFWMREQVYDYYRRHLMIHEVTHCFMTVMPDVEAPVWYMEGMAEYFGTHVLDANGVARFRVMPTSPEDFTGFGRINLIRDDYAAGRAKSIPAILDLNSIEFVKDEPYAWSWALCVFLDTHPRYQARFRAMKQYLQRNAFPNKFIREFRPDSRDLTSEWAVYAQNLQYGYDTQLTPIDFRAGTVLTDEQPVRRSQIRADRGWQSSEVVVEAGRRYEVSATGRFELAREPKPWISEPQGISFRYFKGRPLGQLLACIRQETGETDSDLQSMLVVQPIGRAATIQPTISGTIYFRINDDWNSLADNQGDVTVEIRATPAN